MDRARIVFLAAVAAIAVHVVDDSFVQPEDGTSAGDHLVSGLVPLALLGLAALMYPRVRAGWRAVLALVAGLFGVVAGLEGWHYTREVGASGDDYTGLVALPAGVVLLVLGVVVLWRSRRTEGSRPRRYVRRVLVAVAGAFVALNVVLPFMAGYPYTHIGRAKVPSPNLGGARFENVKFETADGLELEGWYIPSRNRAAVIAFPGRKGPRDKARFLARHGYGVLLFDRRGEGASEGDPNSFGWGGTKDVDAAIEFLRRRPEVNGNRIGGIGLSVGGEMLIEAAAENDRLAAVVSEGAGIRSVREAMEQEGGTKWSQLPTWASTTLGTMVFSDKAPPPNLKDLVGRLAPRPLFLIHAERGQGGEDLNPDYFEAAGEPKQLWKTDSGHTGGFESAPKEYERRVVRFFDDALRAPEPELFGGVSAAIAARGTGVVDAFSYMDFTEARRELRLPSDADAHRGGSSRGRRLAAAGSRVLLYASRPHPTPLSRVIDGGALQSAAAIPVFGPGGVLAIRTDQPFEQISAGLRRQGYERAGGLLVTERPLSEVVYRVVAEAGPGTVVFAGSEELARSAIEGRDAPPGAAARLASDVRGVLRRADATPAGCLRGQAVGASLANGRGEWVVTVDGRADAGRLNVASGSTTPVRGGYIMFEQAKAEQDRVRLPFRSDEDMNVALDHVYSSFIVPATENRPYDC